MEDTLDLPQEPSGPSAADGPLFSLVAGEGDGFMLGLAAGDSAGGFWELGYSAITEQATVIAYQLIEHRRLDPETLTRGLRELDGSEDEDPVYRAETAQFRAWLDRAATGSPTPSDEPSLDGAARGAVVGVAFRREPAAVVRESLALGRMFDRDAASLVATVLAATSVAASCFGQAGRDLIAGVTQASVTALDRLGHGVSGGRRIESVPDELAALAPIVGVSDGHEALELVGGDREDPLHAVMAALVLSAPIRERYHSPVEQAARIGGSPLAAFAGALIGARLGIRAWPWAFANDTWFAEIGRRLVRGPDEIRDLPIPYAVEQHLMYGSRHGFH